MTSVPQSATTAPGLDQAAPPSKPLGAWSPLRIAVFRAIWIANVVSLIGTWAQEAGGPWLMGLLTGRKFLISAVTAVGSLAICLFSLTAGILADVLDRRRLLIFTQIWMFLAAGALAALYYLGPVSPATNFGREYGPGILLGLTFLLYLGAALSGPAFQYVVPELVPPEQMPLAIGLNSVALNLARAAGPFLGMLITAAASPGACFLFNALTFIGVAWVLWRWKGHHQNRSNPERFGAAMRAGLRYVSHSPPLRAILIRVFAFISCASALWGLVLPYAKNVLGLQQVGFGVLMAFLGVGAVGGVFLMPPLQRKLSTDGMVALCTAMFAAGVAGIGAIHIFWIDCLLMAFVGANWVIIPTSFNVATQRSVPGWVKGRAISMYLTVLFGSLSMAAFWGWLADKTSVPTSLLCASAGLALGLLLVRPFPLTRAQGIDFKPARNRIKPVLSQAPDGNCGPVMVTIEYQIAPENAAAFSTLMHQLRLQRLRDGSYGWGLYNSAAAPRRYIETFIVQSWAEHLRQHDRMTTTDAILEEKARALHHGETPPLMSHWLHAPAQPEEAASTFKWPLMEYVSQEARKWQRRMRRS